MDFYLYFIIIIGLTIFILFYGGHNQQSIVEYNSEYFDNLNIIIFFENILNKNIDNVVFDENNFININKFFNIPEIIIPNFVNCFYVQIKPYALFNIYNLIEKQDIKTSMMIIFNHQQHNNLELLVGNPSNNLYTNCSITTNNNDDDNNNDNDNNNVINYGYFYDLEKIISITGIYHIYNNSINNVIVTCFIVKKPFWHK